MEILATENHEQQIGDISGGGQYHWYPSGPIEELLPSLKCPLGR